MTGVCSWSKQVNTGACIECFLTGMFTQRKQVVAGACIECFYGRCVQLEQIRQNAGACVECYFDRSTCQVYVDRADQVNAGACGDCSSMCELLTYLTGECRYC